MTNGSRQSKEFNSSRFITVPKFPTSLRSSFGFGFGFGHGQEGDQVNSYRNNRSSKESHSSSEMLFVVNERRQK